jgi:hypothetical protein
MVGLSEPTMGVGAARAGAVVAGLGRGGVEVGVEDLEPRDGDALGHEALERRGRGQLPFEFVEFAADRLLEQEVVPGDEVEKRHLGVTGNRRVDVTEFAAWASACDNDPVDAFRRYLELERQAGGAESAREPG